MTTPFNPVAHDHLISVGYTHARVDADYWDAGDPENGPDVQGYEAFDEYTRDLPKDGMTEAIALTQSGGAHRAYFPIGFPY